MYIYIQSEPQLWTVGFYEPSGKWHSESDHSSREEAAKRIASLNGSNALPDPEKESSQGAERIVFLLEHILDTLHGIKSNTARRSQ